MPKGELEGCRRQDPSHDFILQREDILHWPVVALGPQVSARGRIHQSGGNSHLSTSLLHAALQHVLHPELAAYLLLLYRFALVGERRIAGDDKQAREPGEGDNKVIRNAIAEVLLISISAHVGKWQHRNRTNTG